jgi:predicted lipoprotein with Yx(FWY)xxD motif
MRKRATYMGALLAIVGALVIAGCGGGGSSSSSSSAESGGGENAGATTAAEGSSGEGTIAGAEVGGLGSVLVDSEGMTVYLYTPDTGTTSTCYGECESVWPPVIAEGKPSAGEGAMSSALGTTKRKDGSMQVTYEGHPLYTFSGDKAAGEATGQGFEGIWFVLDESGNAVEGEASASAEGEESEESSGGYGGY